MFCISYLFFFFLFPFHLDKFCPGTFDGWLCWPDTPAGTSAYEKCPEFITGFDPLSK